MSLILVIEQDATYSERIQGALAAEGWSVRVVTDHDSALAAARAAAPDLVVLSAAVNGAVELMRAFARAHGGPGVVVLHPSVEAPPHGADGALAKPFTDEQLRVSVRRCLSRVQRAAAEAAAAEAASSGAQLTSRDLFGDLLAEVEEEAARPPAARPAAPARRTEDEVERQLEQTLSGVLSAQRPARPAPPPAASSPPPAAVAPAPPPAGTVPPPATPPAAPTAPKPPTPAVVSSRGTGAGRAKSGTEIDDLLSQTLSGLGVGTKPKPKPAAPAPRPAEAPASPAAVPAAPPLPPPAVPTAAMPPATPAPVATSPVAAPRPAVTAPQPTPEPPRREPPAVEPPRQEPRREPERREPPKPEPPKKVDRRPPSPPADHGLATQRVEVVRPAAPAPAAAAAQFGQYTLLERVALGGMAEVWKARMKGMEGFQKTVAIKKILAHLTDSVDFVTMFIDEAKLAAQLNHPHIIHIYDLGKIDDDYYIAMEYVEGKDLRSILNTARKQDSPLPLGIALLVAARLASALDYAHRKRDFDNRELGLVHRDVSPQNVLISYEGDIKLCDFGIAKAVAKASKTQMGALKGKLQYMSPEQAWGRVVDGRSDIFSLGSVLFEMLTGRRLFAGESEMSVLEAVRECRLQSVRELSPAVPEVVDAIVRRALAKDPDDRYQTAGEMQKELESVLYSLKPTPGQGDLVTYMQRLHAGEPLAGGAPAAAAQALPGEREVPAVVPLGAVGEPEGRRRPWLLPAAAAGIVVVGLVAWLATRGGGGEQQAAATEPGPPAAASVAPAGLPLADPATPAATPGFATPGVDAAAGLAQRVEAELRAKEEQLAAELEAQRRQIQAELQQTPAPQPTARTTPTATPAPAEEPALAADTPEPEPPPPPPPVNTPRPQAPPPPAATAREEPAAPAVREGELVAAGTPGLRSPAFVSFTKPEYPPLAKRLGVEGTVMVSVLVNESGQVDDVRLVKGVTQNVGINEAAVRAARSARYRPATLSGVRVKTWTNLTIPFRL